MVVGCLCCVDCFVCYGILDLVKFLFIKMYGVGNDFVVFDGYLCVLLLFIDVQVCVFVNCYFGIGVDQLLLVEKLIVDGVDFKYWIFNCDGGEVEYCGNGVCCFVKFVSDCGLIDKCSVCVQVMKGLIMLMLQDNGEVVVDMGVFVFVLVQVLFDVVGFDGCQEGCDMLWLFDVGGVMCWILMVLMGNLYVVQVVDDVEVYLVLEEGLLIECYVCFLQCVNVGFMQIVLCCEVKLCVYECGVGEMFVCGIGVCVVVVVGIWCGLFDLFVIVYMYGGMLMIGWDGVCDEVVVLMMVGFVMIVFEGEIDLNV